MTFRAAEVNVYLWKYHLKYAALLHYIPNILCCIHFLQTEKELKSKKLWFGRRDWLIFTTFEHSTTEL
jgi:hypothetical protein